MSVELVNIQEGDYPYIKEIYNYYVLNTTITFRTDPVDEEELKSYILNSHPRYRSFLIESEGKTCGYCYLSRYRNKKAYDRTAEISIYLHPDYQGKGIGTKVLAQIENIARECGIKVLVAMLTEENAPSIGLFEKCAYTRCAHFREVGEKFDRLLDVVAYQKILVDN